MNFMEKLRGDMLILYHITVVEKGLPTSDFRLPTSDFRLPTSTLRLPIVILRLLPSLWLFITFPDEYKLSNVDLKDQA